MQQSSTRSHRGKPYLRLRRSLADPVPAAAIPAGLHLVPFGPANGPALHALLELAYRDGFGSVANFETWWPWLTKDEEFDPALCFVLSDANSRPAGFCQCWTSGFIKDLVVHPDWRGRGVGEALLLMALAAFAARGLPHAELKVDSDNLQALRLYHRVGFQPEELLIDPPATG